MSLCVEQEIQTEIDQAEYVSILCDETTDTSVTKQLMVVVYLRYVIQGDLKVRYFKIHEVIDGTADTKRCSTFDYSGSRNSHVKNTQAV